MFSHLVIGANDIDASKAFYDAALGALGLPPGKVQENGRVFYIGSGGLLILTSPIDGKPATHANGGTIGFAAGSPEQVEAWHAAGVANGGTSCEDPPGIRENKAGPLYLAYLRDPAGNKICAMHRLG